MDKQHLLGAIARLRRSMPRNADVIDVCEALEGVILSPVDSGTNQPPKRTSGLPSFNKQLYMKSYMREYRQGKRRTKREQS